MPSRKRYLMTVKGQSVSVGVKEIRGVLGKEIPASRDIFTAMPFAQAATRVIHAANRALMEERYSLVVVQEPKRLSGSVHSPLLRALRQYGIVLNLRATKKRGQRILDSWQRRSRRFESRRNRREPWRVAPFSVRAVARRQFERGAQVLADTAARPFPPPPEPDPLDYLDDGDGNFTITSTAPELP